MDENDRLKARVRGLPGREEAEPFPKMISGLTTTTPFKQYFLKRTRGSP